jgi:hypothetical protein
MVMKIASTNRMLSPSGAKLYALRVSFTTVVNNGVCIATQH